MIRRIFLYIFFLVLAFVPGVVNAAPPVSTAAKQAIVVDYDTGAVLFEKNADERMPTSSMSKVMTMYAVFQDLKNGALSLGDTLPVSEKAWRKEGSKMFVEVGKQVKVEDLIRGVIVQSGNDATIVLAEGLSGSEDAFANRINEIAAGLGMTNSHFMNASGWPDPDHYSTARDLSILARSLMENFPNYYHYYGEQEFTYNNIKQANRNPLLYRNMGADGVKTGHTEAGGYGLIGSGKRMGRRVIVVVNGLPDEKSRAQESAKLLDWGLDHFENKTLFEAGRVVTQVPVFMSKESVINAVLNDKLFATVPKGQGDDLEKVVTLKSLEAPVMQGAEVGTLTIKIPGQPDESFPLYAETPATRLGFFAGLLVKLKMFITNFVADKMQGAAEQISLDAPEAPPS